MKLKVILPMKGYSQRIKNKNLKNFNGFPLYHYIVKSLLASKYIENIIIDTDSDKIENDVKKSFSKKVTVLRRPDYIIDEVNVIQKIIKHNLNILDGEYFMQTHSTNPLLTTDTINRSIETFFNNLSNYDSVFSVTKMQTRFYDKNSKPINHDITKMLRTQDLEPYYEENSNFYIFSKSSFEKSNSRIGLTPLMFEMDKIESIDIDEPEDFKLAEILYKARQ